MARKLSPRRNVGAYDSKYALDKNGLDRNALRHSEGV